MPPSPIAPPSTAAALRTARARVHARSDGMTCPLIVRDRPTARSHTSMNSCTSPTPSARILPISSEIRAPSASRFARSASPICRTISPRAGAGFCGTGVRADGGVHPRTAWCEAALPRWCPYRGAAAANAHLRPRLAARLHRGQARVVVLLGRLVDVRDRLARRGVARGEHCPAATPRAAVAAGVLSRETELGQELEEGGRGNVRNVAAGAVAAASASDLRPVHAQSTYARASVRAVCDSVSLPREKRTA